MAEEQNGQEEQLPAGHYEISAKASEKDEAGNTIQKHEGTVVVQLGANHTECAQLHGEEATDAAWIRGATLKVQSDMRQIMLEGGDQARLEEYFAPGKYKMDFTRKERTVDPRSRLRRILATMSEEEQEEFFAEYGA